jgi:hypothetical protein
MRLQSLLLLVLATALLGVVGCMEQNAVEPEVTASTSTPVLTDDGACIGDLVWFDENQNGCQDDGEPGVENIVVELYMCDVGLVGTVETDETGYYCFFGLEAGRYYVQWYTRDNYFFTHQTPCQDDFHDSDANQETGRTVCFDVGTDECLKSVDAGLCKKPGGEGCTPGYWKNHLDAWVGYDPGDDFNTTFGCELMPGGTTFDDAINAKGGHENALARHAVAALLNAASPDVSYDLTEDEIIALVCGADSNWESVKDMLDELNNSGCPLGGYGEPNGD